MARKRMIDPNIWQSEDFNSLSILARLVFIGMFSNADDEGRGRAKPVYLKSVIFPYDENIRVVDVEKTLSEISSKMSVTLYSHNENEYYQLDNWQKWQTINRPQESNIPAKPIIIEQSLSNHGTINEQSMNNHGVITDEFVLKEYKRKEVKGKEVNNNIVRSENARSSDFEKFWSVYPLKVGKKKAEEKYLTLVKKGFCEKEIITGAENFLGWAKRNEVELLPHATTWLNGERWNDELVDRPKKQINSAIVNNKQTVYNQIYNKNKVVDDGTEACI